MSSGIFLKWLLTMVPIVFSAGPNNIMCASSGAALGIRKTIPFIAGINSIILIYSLVVGFSFSLLLSVIPQFIPYIRVAGAIYLIYLAWLFLQSAKKESTGISANLAFGYYNGLILSSLNPKLIVALLIMFSQFLGNQSGSLQVLWLSLITVTLSVAAHFTWAAGGSLIFAGMTNKKVLKYQAYFFSAMMFGVAIWIMLG